MKYWRKTSRTALAALTVTALAATAACASNAPADTQTAESEKPTGPVEITFSSWLRNSAQVVEAFNASQDEVKVTFQEVASGADNYPQLTNQVTAGTAPDVVTVEYPRVADMATQGVLQDITDIAGDLVDSSFPDSVKSLVQFGGTTWSVPLDLGVYQFFYREDLFQQHGIEVPTTWEEYVAAAEKVAAADPNVRIGASTLGDPAAYAALAWQHGATWAAVDGDSWKIDIDSPETEASAEFQQDLVDRGLVWTDEAEALQQKQAAGQLLSVISGSWYGAGLTQTYPDQAGKWKVAPLPGPDGPTAAMYGGSTFGISANSEKQEAALTFIEWMTTNPEGIKARIDGGASTVFPANAEARSAASEAFDTAFFGGQDIYAVAEEGVDTIPAGWLWGPATSTTLTALADGSAKVKAGQSKLTDIFGPAQEATVSDMKNRGISVK
ncbi:ABC transporter substrate-binding protein [Antribacter gilvus]|uniref:ABC transporter substrate-binding protein n=1 Tax=Antribacter gilvus TaxID=2304675 RepID=UPI000F795D55|nr:sugar ABC transporter substrate-binding protein [Antribacter gilvus]